jgi:cellulose synthase/poly-beta-1,6-N-acetylglucosamine synthase-like glycosyltransferase
MTDSFVIAFWLSMAVLLYTYLGYGVLVYLLAKLKQRKGPPEILPDDQLPAVTVVIAAYNEARYIEEKINNTFSLDYPPDKLRLLVVTDGSDDGTPEIVARHKRVTHMHLPERRGKIHAVNRVMQAVETPIVVFSDANTTLNRMAIKTLVRPARAAPGRPGRAARAPLPRSPPRRRRSPRAPPPAPARPPR